MATETAAAATGGVTSFMDMPNCNPQTTTLEALENKFKDAATKCIVNYSFYFGATNNNADQLKALDKTHVCGVKLFMGPARKHAGRPHGSLEKNILRSGHADCYPL